MMPYSDPRDEKRWRTARSLGYLTSPVDVVPVRDHVAQLVSVGFSAEAIAQCASVTRPAVHAIVKGTTTSVRRSKATALLAVCPQRVFAEVDDATRVPAYGVRRRVEALVAMGWRSCDLTALHRLARQRVMNGGESVLASVHRAFAEQYDEMCLTAGPSNRSRIKAERRGWLPPIAWDDIDDPHEDPLAVTASADFVDEIAVERVIAGEGWAPLTSAEVNAAITLGIERELNYQQIANLLRMSHDAVTKRIVRHGLDASARSGVAA